MTETDPKKIMTTAHVFSCYNTDGSSQDSANIASSHITFTLIACVIEARILT